MIVRLTQAKAETYEYLQTIKAGIGACKVKHLTNGYVFPETWPTDKVAFGMIKQMYPEKLFQTKVISEIAPVDDGPLHPSGERIMTPEEAAADAAAKAEQPNEPEDDDDNENANAAEKTLGTE